MPPSPAAASGPLLSWTTRLQPLPQQLNTCPTYSDRRFPGEIAAVRLPVGRRRNQTVRGMTTVPIERRQEMVRGMVKALFGTRTRDGAQQENNWEVGSVMEF